MGPLGGAAGGLNCARGNPSGLLVKSYHRAGGRQGVKKCRGCLPRLSRVRFRYAGTLLFVVAFGLGVGAGGLSQWEFGADAHSVYSLGRWE